MYEMLKAAFWRADSVKATNFLSGFLSSEVVGPLLKMPDARNVDQQAKQMNMCTE
jgi:hypothetical protein